LRNQSNEYGAFRHFVLRSGRGFRVICSSNIKSRRDDSTFRSRSSGELRNRRCEPTHRNYSSSFHNRTVLPGISLNATCTLLCLTALKRNHRLKLLIRDAKFRLDLLRSRNDAL
jgi:hypothetical protein